MMITWGDRPRSGFVLSFGYWTTDFLVVQRAFSPRICALPGSLLSMHHSPKWRVPIIVVITGLIALVLAGRADSGFALLQDNGQINYDSRSRFSSRDYYPRGLVGLGVSALLAGFMAGQAGNISAFNTVWTYDIYRSVSTGSVRQPPDGRRSGFDDRGGDHQRRTAYWAKGISEHHGLHAGDLLLGECSAVRDDAPRECFVVWITPNGAILGTSFWGWVLRS